MGMRSRYFLFVSSSYYVSHPTYRIIFLPLFLSKVDAGPDTVNGMSTQEIFLDNDSLRSGSSSKFGEGVLRQGTTRTAQGVYREGE